MEAARCVFSENGGVRRKWGRCGWARLWPRPFNVSPTAQVVIMKGRELKWGRRKQTVC